MSASVNARTFKSGNSEAVRLPKGLGFGIGKDITIRRDGKRIVLTEVSDPAEEKRKLMELIAAMDALPKPSTIEKREPIEFRG